MKGKAAAFALAGLLSACTWVHLTPEGEKVRVLDADEVTQCQMLGRTTVSLAAKIAGIERHPEDVQKELNMLARNSAVDLRGDTVVATSPVENGKQTFAVYRCMPQ
ncbi:MAG: DUF4156 domain-containing protein [Gammaproteobacteria bacterium]|nr:DUF4156 domain-containing protein [Gammaproteobacteria bacterium]